MRWMLAFLCLVAWGGELLAQQPGRENDGAQAQVQAAILNATDSLQAQIEAIRINLPPPMTVGEFLARMHDPSPLRVTLQRAQLIGGARWSQAGVCEVRLEISGARVAQALLQISACEPKRSPWPADTLARAIEGWSGQMFDAKGSSVSASAVTSLQPPPGSRDWDAIDPAIRRQTIEAARVDAVRRALEGLRPLVLDQSITANELLAEPACEKPIEQWLNDRPIARIEFNDGLRVHIVLSIEVARLASVLHDVAMHCPAIQNARVNWDLVGQSLAKMVFPPGIAAADLAPATRPAEHLVPHDAPIWANSLLETQGRSDYLGSPLRTAAAARAQAMSELERKLSTLPLSKSLTMREAAQRDQNIAAAFRRGMLRARVFKADYEPDGSVMMSVSLDLGTVWADLAAGN